MGRVTILLAALALLAPVAASGSILPYPIDRQVSNTRTIVATQIAAEFMVPVCPATFYMADMGPLILGAAASPPDCVIWITPGLDAISPGRFAWEDRVFDCTIRVHELLHVDGYRNAQGVVVAGGVDFAHSPDSRSVMFAAAFQSVLWPCAHRFTPRGDGVVWRHDFPGLPWSTFP